MKFLRILFGNLTLYFQKSKSIFLLYCVCGVMSTIAFLYFYGNMVPIIANRNSTEFYYREFTLNGTLSPDDLYKLNEEALVEAVTMIHVERDENDRSQKTYIAADLGTSPALVSAMGESSFTEGDRYSVLAPIRSDLSIGDAGISGKKISRSSASTQGTNTIFPCKPTGNCRFPSITPWFTPRKERTWKAAGRRRFWKTSFPALLPFKRRLFPPP